MTNEWIYVNVCGKGAFTYDQAHILNKVLTSFGCSYSDKNDLMAMTIKHALDYACLSDNCMRESAWTVCKRLKQQHETEGPIFEAWIDFEKSKTVRCLIKKFSISFEIEGCFLPPVRESLIDFIKHVTPHEYHSLIMLSSF